MPSISFPRTNSIAQNQSKKTNLEDKQSQIEQEHPLLFAANYNTQERKNELLTKMLTDNLVNKSGTEIKDYCIKELRAVSCIVDAHGNKVNADNNLRMSALGLDDNHVSNLLALFENRDTGLFGRQNINRTAAKYVEVLRQTLQTVDRNSFATDLSVPEQQNLAELRAESNKWYRGDYIQNVRVDNDGHTLNIRLGEPNGTMDRYYQMRPIQISSELKTHNTSSSHTKKQDIVCLKRIENIDDLVLKISRINVTSPNTIIMLDEFDLEIYDVLVNKDRISEIVKSKGISLIMAPTNPYPLFDRNEFLDAMKTGAKTRGRDSWDKISTEASKYGFTCEKHDDVDKERMESVGMFFGCNGSSYIFPKLWEKQPVHKIPGTSIGVTICGEITRISPENLEGVSILFNPSREHDDIYIKYRMRAYIDNNISKEDILREIEADFMKKNSLDNVKEEVQKDIKAGFHDEANHIFNAIIPNKSKRSMYVNNRLYDYLNIKTIPIVRADGTCSGLLNPSDRISLEQFTDTDNSCTISIAYTPF